MKAIAAAGFVLLLSSAAFAQSTTPEKPVDKGPYTPQANGAFQGGGAVMEGQPGGPPPPPSAVLQLPPNVSPPAQTQKTQ